MNDIKKNLKMEKSFKIFDFNVYNEKVEDDEIKSDKDTQFIIQIFGINELGKTCSIITEDYKPFFYIKVDDSWGTHHKTLFLEHIQKKIGKYYENSITECKLIKRKNLYGFDGGKEHKFLLFKFASTMAFNKVKNLWYTSVELENGDTDYRLLPHGYIFNNTRTKLYESNIPPLLRFFHIKEISPSGWIALPNSKTKNIPKTTTCTYEFAINYKHIIALNNKETIVPYKICSFDIEASSSHGDFPIPTKNYKKLAMNIVDYFDKLTINMTEKLCKQILTHAVLTAFGYEKLNGIELVYPKKEANKSEIAARIQTWIEAIIPKTKDDLTEFTEENDEEETIFGFGNAGLKTQSDRVYQVICDKNINREHKINELTKSFKPHFSQLHGDKVTFIGSTFLNYGSPEPYLNHCIVLDTCDAVANAELETYDTEAKVLLNWSKLIQRENPDIMIGYNITGFDYNFMFHRARECGCEEEFLKLSRNVGEICATKCAKTNQYKIEESSICLASGTHELKYVKMPGRIQLDLYNHFRREENLASYKLDNVASHFIGDYVKNVRYESGITFVNSGNLTGLHNDSYIHFEEIGHTTNNYKNGIKLKVQNVNKTNGTFEIVGEELPDMTQKVRWGLAKDDVTPKDIFRMTHEGPTSRAVIAKYCIQDCNLVHYLANKIDVMTGLVEMAKICSVPISFLIFRGQGIKLTSYVAKKCREKQTLMPVLQKDFSNDGFEGAIVLDPKCNLYDIPVPVGDFASLYPSSMISENLSHDSKVWSKEYDLSGNLIKEKGEKVGDKFIYDNLPEYEYVDITFDTFKYVKKTPASTAEKIKNGHKTCRYAQFPNGKAIMPSILEELLSSRKATRKMIATQTDDFMKNVLDKRQLAYKITANSLYGQCGAKTSTFYEQDVAAATTATGRLLLTYAKKVVEDCYGDLICDTKYGQVHSKAEYIYGDTDSVFFTFNLHDLMGEKIIGQRALELSIDLAKEATHLVSQFLKMPHDFEYEKTFMPFCLLSKKRYVGIKYEHDPTKGKRNEMGIVLKRRDNAPIVKDIYGGIIDILMKETDIKKAIEFLKSSLQDIIDEKCPIDKLIISKSLNSNYKNPKQIAHKVLADRMYERDPGNKPSSGDRITFVYVTSNNKKALQGEKIETPAFIRENNLQIDYSFYITNQIMKPVQQLFALVLENIWTMQKKLGKISNFKKEVAILKRTVADDKFEDRLDALKNKEIKELLFDEYLRVTNNKKTGNQSMTSFFKKI